MRERERERETDRERQRQRHRERERERERETETETERQTDSADTRIQKTYVPQKTPLSILSIHSLHLPPSPHDYYLSK